MAKEREFYLIVFGSLALGLGGLALSEVTNGISPKWLIEVLEVLSTILIAVAIIACFRVLLVV